MRTLLKIVLLLLVSVLGLGQQSRLDSLRRAFRAARTDSARASASVGLVDYYSESNRDSALYYANMGLSIVQKNGHALDVASLLDAKGYILNQLGKFPESLAAFQQALQLAQDPGNEKSWFRDKKFTPHQWRVDELASMHHDMGHLMGATGNIDQQIAQYREAERLAKEAGNKDDLLGLVNMNLGYAYEKLGRLDSSLILNQNAERIMKQTGYKKYLGYVYEEIGNLYLRKGNKQLALQNYHRAVIVGTQQGNTAGVVSCYDALARYFLAEKQKDSALFYSRKGLALSKWMGPRNLGPGYEDVYKSYALAGKTDSAYKYQGLALDANDSTYKTVTKNLADFQKLSFRVELHAQELEKEKAAIQTRIRTYVLLAGIAVFMLIAGITYRNNRQKQKANHLLSRQNEEIVQQKEEIESQRDHLEQAFEDLKSTQTQLIQREKMASLGELTAGIAHEIQNPLNFVNNFSEVNKEMLEELKVESAKPKAERDDQLEIGLINDLIENEAKINHHGRRADTIVKGMLEHSRTGTGEKQPTDINALADEFLKLSYHGLRAKDKSFNAEMVTNFDPSLPKINVVQQDMGRVMLNLINNAFYAVNQRAKTAGPDYKPSVQISTSAKNGQMGIQVKDNGNGIPDTIKDKIMQPFFTTKPTGEGTGLGLSLSYDIVVKGHGGSISVNTKEGEFTEFTVMLPA
ncbi:MAG TPA: ATP-binding protein [Mucilaginibacter sp.]|jgi:signal transduction histidine kinase/predicted negative regulator of RcsB-dependent stress response|nr:ATP-binding protein [Mucilaginibacter sp.]